MENLIIGQHVSFKSDSQLVGSVKEALSYGANTFMFYTGAPQNTTRKEINLDLTKEGQELMKENHINIHDVIVHAPYIINLANPTNSDFGIRFLKEEIKRCETLGITKIVLHPGSHVGIGIDQAIINISEALNHVLEQPGNVIILLETMAGKGTEVGSKFEEIKAIIDHIQDQDRIGVCLDTCHIHDAGYDLTQFDQILEEFDRIIGLKNLGCVHINDSKNNLASHKDRHENIGFGTIGFDRLIKVIYHEKLKGIPKILETPFVSIKEGEKDRSYPPHKFEIQMIKTKQFSPDLLKQIREFYK
mgnify:FL=1